MMSFWDHLEELRWVIIRICIVIAVGTLISMNFHSDILQIVTKPLHSHNQLEITHSFHNPTDTPQSVQYPGMSHTVVKPHETVTWQEAVSPSPLALLAPTEGFTAIIKLSVWVSLFLTSPVWLGMICKFLAPGLQQKERGWLFPFLVLSLGLLFLGAVFGYVVSLPIANHFFLGLNAQLAQNVWSLSAYLNYTLLILLGHAIAFESLAILFLFIHKGWIEAETLCRKRKHIVVGVFIVSAILTPPDVITQCLLAGPIWALFEVGILYARFRARKLRSQRLVDIT